MSSNPSAQLTGWDCVHDLLAQIRTSHKGFEGFFSEVFDQLEVMFSDLVARRQQWQSERRRAESELARQTAELAEARQELKQRQEEVPSEGAEAPRPADGELQEQLQRMQQEQAARRQERAALETELEAVRNRAAELTEALAEQKRQTAQQQNEWSAEFKQMRCLLEKMAKGMIEREADSITQALKPHHPRDEATQPREAPAHGNPVLESVSAQFRMLQKDVARRRQRHAG